MNIRPITSRKIVRAVLFLLGLIVVATIAIGVYYDPQSALDAWPLTLLAFAIFLLVGWGEDIPSWVLQIMGRNPPENHNLNPYESIIKTAEDESEQAAERLRMIGLRSDSDSFVALSEALGRELDKEGESPVDQTAAIISKIIDMKKYVDEAENLTMDITAVREDKIIVRTSDSDAIPEQGVLFNVSCKTVTNHQGEAITDRENVAVAKFVEQRGERTLVMEIIDTKEDTVGNKQELLSTLMNEDPKVEVRTEGEEQIDWDKAKQTHGFLRASGNSMNNYVYRR